MKFTYAEMVKAGIGGLARIHTFGCDKKRCSVCTAISKRIAQWKKAHD